MFKIGEFARLTRVPLKTLHYYDDIDLFKPESVDVFTGYRYYSFDQLPRLNRILALKGLGFSLEQIRKLLDSNVSTDELRGMLRLRRAQLEQQVEDVQDMLTQVEIRLKQIELEGNVPQIDVLIKAVEPLTIAGAREVVPDPALMRERCIALDKATCKLIESAKLKTDGTSFALYYSADEKGIDVEMAYAVDAPAKTPSAQGNAAVHELPAATVAYAVYKGSYDDFGAVGQLSGAIAKWAEENGYRITGAVREWYLRPPRGPADLNAVMEIQYPVERSG